MAVTDSGYVLTPYLQELADRASLYLEAGLALHLRGPAGVGKTSLALHLSARRGRPAHVIYGNEAFSGFDLVSQKTGYRSRTLVDNYVRRVMKRVEEVDSLWSAGQLLQAVRGGGTLVYDEFTRSRPEANNVLLAILEEGVTEVPDPRGYRRVAVHPEFRVIFTSNPDEYAGVYGSMDALSDRMVTLDMSGRDDATDVAIVSHCAGLSTVEAEVVVQAVQRRQTSRCGKAALSLRPAIMVGRVLRQAGIPAEPQDAQFRQVCDDIVGPPKEEDAG